MSENLKKINCCFKKFSTEFLKSTLEKKYVSLNNMELG